MNDYIVFFLYAIPAILLSLSFHEMSHAYASYKLGDPTAKRMGRLTLNPLKHLDPMGTLMLVVSMVKGFGFGWAKPVPINPFYYRNQKKGTLIVGLAGPMSNLLLAFIFSLPPAIIAASMGFAPDMVYDAGIGLLPGYSAQSIIFNISRIFYMINIGLATFNILPIPPLDGSKVLAALLPNELYYRLMRYEQFIGLFFLALMILNPGILSTILWPVKKLLEGVVRLLASPVLFLLGFGSVIYGEFY